jgi:hypothetical protein
VSWSLKGSDVETCSCELMCPCNVSMGEPVRFSGMSHPVASNLTMAEAKRSRINAFGIQFEGKTGLSTAEFSWAA